MKLSLTFLTSLTASVGLGLLAARRIANAPPDPDLAERANRAAASGPWEHHYTEVNGLRFHYAAVGREGAPLVVLLHGFPQCWYEWAHIMPRLAAQGHFRVVAPDMRGYNLTEKPGGIQNYTLEKLASDVDTLIRALGYTHAHIVAHDWGGAVAWQAALDYPRSIDKLVVINAPFPDRYNEVVFSDFRQAMRSYYIFLFQLPILAEAMCRLSIRASLRNSARVPGAFPDEALDVYENGISQPGAATAMLNYYRAAVRKNHTTFSRGRLVTRPTLVIWGMDDFALLPELSDGLQPWIPDLQVEQVPATGHWVPEERPTLVTESLLRFLR